MDDIYAFKKPTKDDIEEFANYIQRWKSASNDKTEVLKIYQDHTNYLLIPLLFENIRNNKENTRNQEITNNLSLAVLGIAFVALIGTFYEILKDFDINRLLGAFGIAIMLEIILIWQIKWRK